MRDVDHNAPPRPLRLRFSLATLIFVATLICLLVALWATWLKLRNTEAQFLEAKVQNEEYRHELGYLTISDPERVHAVAIRTPGSLRWQWRVYLPKDRRFKMRLITGGVPQHGIPEPGTTSGATSTLLPGELLLDAAVQQDRQGEWVLWIDKQGGTLTIGIPQTGRPWIEEEMGWSLDAAAPGEARSVDPGKPMVLLRLRVHDVVEEKQAAGGVTRMSQESSKPCDGLMIWIEEVPSESDN